MAASVLALSSIVTAALTPDQILSTIQTLTQKSQAVEASAESITVSGGPLGVIIVRSGQCRHQHTRLLLSAVADTIR